MSSDRGDDHLQRALDDARLREIEQRLARNPPTATDPSELHARARYDIGYLLTRVRRLEDQLAGLRRQMAGRTTDVPLMRPSEVIARTASRVAERGIELVEGLNRTGHTSLRRRIGRAATTFGGISTQRRDRLAPPPAFGVNDQPQQVNQPRPESSIH